MATASTPVTIVKYLSGQKRKAEDEPTIYQFFSRSKDPDAKILSNFHKIKKKNNSDNKWRRKRGRFG